MKIEIFFKIFVLGIKNPFYWLILVIVLINVFVAPVILDRYYNFNMANPNDFCERAQALYNTIRGHPLKSCVMPWVKDVNYNIFGDHFFLFLFFLVPFCFIFKTPEFLFVFQNLAITCSAIPLFLIAQANLKNKWLSLGIALCYLFYPLTIKLPFYDLRIEYFAIFWFFCAFYFLEKKKINLSIFFIFLGASCKQNLFLVASFIGLYILFFKSDCSGNKWKGWVIFVVGFLISILYVKFIGPYFCIDNKYIPYEEHYGYWVRMGLNPMVIRSFLHPPKWAYFFKLFGILGFIPLLSKEILIIIPGVLQNLLVDLHLPQWNLDPSKYITQDIYHNSFMLPFLFIGFIYGIKKILGTSIRKFLLIIIIANIFYGLTIFANIAVFPFVKGKLWIKNESKLYKDFLKIKNMLNPNWPIVVHFPLFSGFWDFEKTFISDFHGKFSLDINKVDYAIWLKGRDYNEHFFNECKKSFSILFEDDQFLVMRKEFNLMFRNFKRQSQRTQRRN